MRRRSAGAKPGFALLEAMVFVILMLLLGAAMLGGRLQYAPPQPGARRKRPGLQRGRRRPENGGRQHCRGRVTGPLPGRELLHAGCDPRGRNRRAGLCPGRDKRPKGTFSLGSDSYEGVRLTLPPPWRARPKPCS